MSKRKRYDRTARLRDAARGVVIPFNGDPEDHQRARTASGLPLSRVMLEYVTQYPFRWRVTVGFVFTGAGGLTKVVEREIEPQQAVRLNDLSELIAAYQMQAALELGEFWAFSHKVWEARIL